MMFNPSARRMLIVGIVTNWAVDTVVSHARRSTVGVCGVVIDDHTPRHPQWWRSSLFERNPHKPRSISAMFPATAVALVNGEQPSVVVPAGVVAVAGSAASTAATTFAETLGLPIGGPNAAVPNCSGPAMLAGELTCTRGLPNESTFGTPAITLPPVHTTRPKRVADAWRSASVICGQVRLVVVSSRWLL